MVDTLFFVAHLLHIVGEKRSTMKISTGKGTISLVALVAILSISAVVSLPGLAISPILNDLDSIFPKASNLEIEMLESLPSLLIIPAMLLAGRWSQRGNKVKLLVLGCTIFLLSGIGSMLSASLRELIVLSAVMGFGAGIIIPLSTGFIVDYFTGDYRVKMLGISSAVNNLTLVVATAVVGWLAEIRWHFAFAVYLLPAITLILIPALRSSTPMPEPPEGAQHRQQRLNGGMIVGLMVFYFVITYTSLVVTYNTSALVAKGGMDASTSGVIISLFFLAIMAPGLLLNRLIAVFGNKINLVSLIVMGVGLMLIALMHPTALWLIVGVVMTGLGYGVMQPIIYDKAATNAPPHLATLALSIVMSVNYAAILVAPFLIDGINHLFGIESPHFGFFVSGVITLILALLAALSYRRSRVLGSDD